MKYLLEVVVNPTLNTVCLKTKINISAVPIMHVVLVQHIIETFVKIFKIKKYHCSSSLHTNLDLVNISADLIKHINLKQRYCRHCKNILHLCVHRKGSEFPIPALKYFFNTCVYSLSFGKLLPNNVNGFCSAPSPSGAIC